MNQRVKLQLSSDLVDVPKLTGIILQEAVIEAGKLHLLIEQISNHLKFTELDGEDSLEKINRELDNMDGVRLLLAKIDSRVGDVASILGGLHEVLTKPQQEIQEQKVEQNDNIPTG